MWIEAGAWNLQRYRVKPGEWVRVRAGGVMVVGAVAALAVDGVLSLDGVVRVG